MRQDRKDEFGAAAMAQGGEECNVWVGRRRTSPTPLFIGCIVVTGALLAILTTWADPVRPENFVVTCVTMYSGHMEGHGIGTVRGIVCSG